MLMLSITLHLITLGVAACLGYLFLQQAGRILVRLDAIEQELLVSRLVPVPPDSAVDGGAPLADLPVSGATEAGAEPMAADPSLAKSRINRNGLPVGTRAPPFNLPSVSGSHASIDDYAGRRFILVFSDPGCAPCLQLWPQLAQRLGAEQGPSVLVISRGTVSENLAKRPSHNSKFEIALQRRWEVSEAYGTFTLPSAYVIDEDGRIASPLARDGRSIVALLSTSAGQRTLAS
jgi:peroxiredoxin